MVTVFLQRTRGGYIHAAHPDVTQAHIRVDSLDELPGRLALTR
jgi:hypothetical protein